MHRAMEESERGSAVIQMPFGSITAKAQKGLVHAFACVNQLYCGVACRATVETAKG